jgi:hypothetical protein
MKQIKQFSTAKELDDIVTLLNEAGIKTEVDRDDCALFVHVGDYIKARDIILDYTD